MARRSRPTSESLIRMGELSRRSGVPSSTIKYYMREGLLPGAAVATTRNSALYDPALVEKVKSIKAMQQVQFLPLWRIKELLAQHPAPRAAAVATVAAAVDRALERPANRPVRRATAIARGLKAAELDDLTLRGILPADDPLVGDAAGLVGAILDARRSGLTAHVDVVAVLERYERAVRRLVQAELDVFTADILPSAGESLGPLTEEALGIGERIVAHLRRRMLLPEFEKMLASPTAPAARAPRRKVTAPRSAPASAPPRGRARGPRARS